MQKSYLEVNIENISNNIQKIQKFVGENIEIAPVIKANGYGTGASKLKEILVKNNIKIVVVSSIEEAIVLRKSGFNMYILTLNELLPYEAKKVVEYNLTVGISNLEVIKAINNHSLKENKKIKIHIEIDTGMGRVGIKPIETLNFVEQVKKLKNIEIEGIYTHFSSADVDEEYTKEQIKQFKNILAKLNQKGYKFKYIHASASSGIINYKEATFNMIRPGLIMYGYMPDKNMQNKIDVKPVAKLISHVVFIKEVPKGTSIGYGRTYVTKEKTKIATIPLGYADGIRRLMSNKGSVYINGKYAKIIGNICMDNFMIDVTGINVNLGDKVYVWDNENITLESVADICKTINYEILCGIAARVRRKYI